MEGFVDLGPEERRAERSTSFGGRLQAAGRLVVWPFAVAVKGGCIAGTVVVDYEVIHIVVAIVVYLVVPKIWAKQIIKRIRSSVSLLWPPFWKDSCWAIGEVWCTSPTL